MRMIYFTVSIAWLCMTPATGITFIEEPSNVKVALGGNATFNCRVSGTEVKPSWRINGSQYSPSFIPSQYSPTPQGISVTNVTLRDNGLSFQCFFEVFGGSTIDSSVGHVIIALKSLTTIPNEILATPSSEADSLGLSTVWITSSELYDQNIILDTTAVMQVSPSQGVLSTKLPDFVVATEGSTMPLVMTTSENTSRIIHDSILAYALGGGFAIIAVLVCLAGAITAITVTIYIKRKDGKDMKECGPIYEDLQPSLCRTSQTVVQMKGNICYESPAPKKNDPLESNISLTQNKCYEEATIPNLYEFVPTNNE